MKAIANIPKYTPLDLHRLRVLGAILETPGSTVGSIVAATGIKENAVRACITHWSKGRKLLRNTGSPGEPCVTVKDEHLEVAGRMAIAPKPKLAVVQDDLAPVPTRRPKKAFVGVRIGEPALQNNGSGYWGTVRLGDYCVTVKNQATAATCKKELARWADKLSHDLP